MAIEISREKFKKTVTEELSVANDAMRDVLGELRAYNQERRQEPSETKNSIDLQVLNRMVGKEY